MNNNLRIEIKIITVLVIITIFSITLAGYFNRRVTTKIVKDPSEFYTVASCVEDYIVELSSDGQVYNLLSKNYIKKNNITKENITSKIEFLNSEYTYNFSAQKIYQRKISKNVTKYYVHGLISQEMMDEQSEEQDFYVVVKLYKISSTYSVEPYNGKIFK